MAKLPVHRKMPTNSTDEKSTCLSDTLKDFSKKCTIVGFNQVATRRSWILRVIWALIAFSGLGIAIWQTWGVITEYFEHKVIMKSEWRSEGLQLLPTITICAFTANIGDKLETAKERSEEERKWSHENYKLENKTKKYFNLFQGAIDWNGAVYGIDSVIEEYANKPEAIEGWNNLQLSFMRNEFQQCFTFNSAIDANKWIRAPPYTGVTFYVFLNDNLTFHEQCNTAFMMYMSTPGVAFTCGSGDGSSTTLDMGNNYIASIQWEQFTRIPNRGSKCDCIPSEGESQKKSVYYSDLNPYKYSLEACTKTMMQNISLRLCDCYIDSIPVSHLAADYPEALPCENSCAHVLNMTNIFDECGVPCWEMSFRTTTQTTSLLFFQGDLLKDMKILDDTRWNYSMINMQYEREYNTPGPFILNENNSEESYVIPAYYWADNQSSPILPIPNAYPIPFPTEQYYDYGRDYSNEYLKSRTVMVTVQVQSPMMTVFYETPKYSLSDFWGVIGGNLGLWLGVSAISIAELVELFLVLCGQLFKKWINSNQVTPVKSKHVAVHVMEVSQDSN